MTLNSQYPKISLCAIYCQFYGTTTYIADMSRYFREPNASLQNYNSDLQQQQSILFWEFSTP